MVNVARGAGPSLIIFSQACFGVSRRYSFNVSILVFWTITTFLLIILAFTFPGDQDAMDKELAEYAKTRMDPDTTKDQSFRHNHNNHADTTDDDDDDDDVSSEEDDQFSITESIRSMSFEEVMETSLNEETKSLMSIEDRMHSFDAAGANESMQFIGKAMQEIGHEFMQLGKIGSRSQEGGADYQMIGTNDGGGQGVVWDSGDDDGGGDQNYLTGTGLLNNETTTAISSSSPSRNRGGPDIDLGRGTKDNVQSGFRTNL